MKYTAIIPAAGKGERAQLGYNKALFVMDGKPLIQHTIQHFISDDECECIVIAIPEGELGDFQSNLTNPKILFTTGGPCREESVNQGLAYVVSPYTLIHDAARPYLSQGLLATVKKELLFYPSVIPVLPLGKKTVPDRVIYNQIGHGFIVQTPQGFDTKLLKLAFEQSQREHRLCDYKDDASVVEYYGKITPRLVAGDPSNIKATFPSDFHDTH